MTARRKLIDDTLLCSRCGEQRWVREFRLMRSGFRQAWCADCERAYGRERHGTEAAWRELPAGLALERTRDAFDDDPADHIEAALVIVALRRRAVA